MYGYITRDHYKHGALIASTDKDKARSNLNTVIMVIRGLTAEEADEYIDKNYIPLELEYNEVT